MLIRVFFLFFTIKAQILEFGLAVHEKFVPQDMRPLHKKLVDQFFVMKSSLGLQVRPQRPRRGHPGPCRSLSVRETMR